jgi:aspartyl-tRNA(Asn)/glutamyl-tRNA(Gln) amidotransferase subunit C
MHLEDAMPDIITPELFEHLVELAALELTPQEGEYIRRQLNGQLKVIAELEKIPIPADTPLAAHGISYLPQDRPPMREDEPRPSQLAASILRQAPDADEGFFAVPEIPHTELH